MFVPVQRSTSSCSYHSEAYNCIVLSMGLQVTACVIRPRSSCSYSEAYKLLTEVSSPSNYRYMFWSRDQQASAPVQRPTSFCFCPKDHKFLLLSRGLQVCASVQRTTSSCFYPEDYKLLLSRCLLVSTSVHKMNFPDTNFCSHHLRDIQDMPRRVHIQVLAPISTPEHHPPP